jgi:SnoaL-like protein/glyoxalase/bleomycin resistance protein/dioxygenase superfamily protein
MALIMLRSDLTTSAKALQ